MIESVCDFVVHPFDKSQGEDGTIRVWFTDLDQQKVEATQLSWLSTREQLRAARLRSPLDRQRYVSSCVLTRRVLSNTLWKAPRPDLTGSIARIDDRRLRAVGIDSCAPG